MKLRPNQMRWATPRAGCRTTPQQPPRLTRTRLPSTLQALENHVERTPAFAQDMAASTAIAKEYHYSNKTEVRAGGRLCSVLLQYT